MLDCLGKLINLLFIFSQIQFTDILLIFTIHDLKRCTKVLLELRFSLDQLCKDIEKLINQSIIMQNNIINSQI